MSLPKPEQFQLSFVWEGKLYMLSAVSPELSQASPDGEVTVYLRLKPRGVYEQAILRQLAATLPTIPISLEPLDSKPSPGSPKTSSALYEELGVKEIKHLVTLGNRIISHLDRMVRLQIDQLNVSESILRRGDSLEKQKLSDTHGDRRCEPPHGGLPGTCGDPNNCQFKPPR